MRSLVVVALAASAAGACVENEDIASYASAGTQYCVASAFVFRGVQVDRALEAEAKFTVPLLDGVKVPRTVNGTGHTGPSEFCATSI